MYKGVDFKRYDFKIYSIHGGVLVSTGQTRLSKHVVDVRELLKNPWQTIKFNRTARPVAVAA